MGKLNTVEVGCRIPNGLRATVTGWIDDPQDRSKKIARERGVIEFKGSGGHTGQPVLHNDIAYTDVDAELFDLWMEGNQDTDLVKSGAIFKKGDGGEHEKTQLERKESFHGPDLALARPAPGVADKPPATEAHSFNPEAAPSPNKPVEELRSEKD